MSDIDYYYKTTFISEVKDVIYSNKDSYEWFTGFQNNQFQVKGLDQNFILSDKLLNYLHPYLNGTIRFFKFPSMTFYHWHCDGYQLFNLNLIFKRQNAYTLFETKSQHADPSVQHDAVKSLKICDYEPNYWYVFNAQIKHCIFNADSETRYLLTYNVNKADTKINYKDTVELVKEFEKLSLVN